MQGWRKAAWKGLAGGGTVWDKVLPALAVTSTTPAPHVPGDFEVGCPGKRGGKQL